jgi:transcriptional regulator with XRE-family HTH domain
MDAFIKFLTDYMLEHNLTKSQFAKMIEVSEYRLNSWLTKKSKVYANHLFVICRNLDVKADIVLGLEDEK